MSRYTDKISSDNDDQHKTVARVEQGAFGFTPSQAATSRYASSMAETTDRPDDVQSRVTSFTYDSQDQKLLKHIDNRAFNTLHDGYAFPADDDEWTRLNKQHIAIIIGLGGLYPVPEIVNALLEPQQGVSKKIIDLGTGTGVWANEMARKFPHTEVVGVDLAPPPIELDSIPENIRFEIDNINLGLPHFNSRFDVVHARLVGIGLTNYEKAVSDAISCLKPGGILLWLEGDFDFYGGPDFKCLNCGSDENPSGSFFQRIPYEVRRAGNKAGQLNSDLMDKVLNEGLWNHPEIDPETCKTANLFMPVGSWLRGKDPIQTQQFQYVGALLRQDLMSAHRALHPKLKYANWPENVLNEWSDKADREMTNNKHKMWMRVRLMWGRRRAGPGEPAFPLHPLLSTTSDSDTRATPYPHFYVYNTKEESLQAAERHKRDVNVPPPPEAPLPT